MGETDRRLTGWRFQRRRGQGTSKLRGVVYGWRRGPPRGCIYGIGMSGTPRWYWRRETILRPQWPLCDMLVMWRYLNGLHKSTSYCKKGVEHKKRRLTEEEARAVTSRAFSAYGRPVEMVPSLKYLGRVLSTADDDWLEVVQNLAKARTVWQRISRILSMEEARPWVSGFFFKAVVQLVLIFSAERWVVTRAWDRSWRVSNTIWNRYWRGGLHGGGQTESGNTPQRRRREWRRVLSLWKTTFGKGRIWSHSILRRDLFSIFARRRRGIRGHVWGWGGKNRR